MSNFLLLDNILPFYTYGNVTDEQVETTRTVLNDAVTILNMQYDQGVLSQTEIQYIQALKGLGVGPDRGFTMISGTTQILYVFFIGANDLKTNKDPNWYASTIIHDGGHAWLAQQGKPATGVPVEIQLTKEQILYYQAVRGYPPYIADLEEYANNPAEICARINQGWNQ